MSAFNFISVQVGGRLTADPELKTTASGTSVVSFTVAVNGRKNKDGVSEAEFIPVTAWQQTAEFITRFFRKGSGIFIVGRLHNRSWTANDGTKRTVMEVIASEAHFVDSRSEMAAEQGAAYVPAAYRTPGPAPAANIPAAPAMEEITDPDPDLPF